MPISLLRYCGDFELVDRLVSDLTRNGRQKQIAAQGLARFLECLSRKQKSGHRPLVVDDALAKECLLFEPRAMIDGCIRVPDAPSIRFATPSIEVTVEDEAITVAASGQRAEHIEAVGKHPDLPRLEAFLAHPVEDEIPDLRLVAGRALDIAQV